MKSSRVCWRPGPSGFSRNKYTRKPQNSPPKPQKNAPKPQKCTPKPHFANLQKKHKSDTMDFG